MKEYNISEEQLGRICDFIETSLEHYWDRHTSQYIISGVSYEDGMREMNPEMFDLMKELRRKMEEVSSS